MRAAEGKNGNAGQGILLEGVPSKHNNGKIAK
jgi:hypothetical protein